MQIDRTRVRETFKAYTDAYDTEDEKIRLKIEHTYRVADLCERIARSEGMTGEEASLAWLLGMLHDVGRFEQLRRFGTFIDAESVDHAALGADILFAGARERTCAAAVAPGDSDRDFSIRGYTADASDDELIETAVRVHSAYRVTDGLSERVERFCHILRDADKIDILKVNVDVPLEEIYNTTTAILRSAEVTEAVMQSFFEHHATLRSIKRTPVDHVVGHISLVYELIFPESLRIVQEQGYLKRLLDFKSGNARTMEQFSALREEMESYLCGNR